MEESLMGFISMMMSKVNEDRKNNLCLICRGTIRMSDFRDELSRKEYRISGLCQVCQDDVFKRESEE